MPVYCILDTDSLQFSIPTIRDYTDTSVSDIPVKRGVFTPDAQHPIDKVPEFPECFFGVFPQNDIRRSAIGFDSIVQQVQMVNKMLQGMRESLASRPENDILPAIAKQIAMVFPCAGFAARRKVIVSTENAVKFLKRSIGTRKRTMHRRINFFSQEELIREQEDIERDKRHIARLRATQRDADERAAREPHKLVSRPFQAVVPSQPGLREDKTSLSGNTLEIPLKLAMEIHLKGADALPSSKPAPIKRYETTLGNLPLSLAVRLQKTHPAHLRLGNTSNPQHTPIILVASPHDIQGKLWRVNREKARRAFYATRKAYRDTLSRRTIPADVEFCI